MQQGKGPWAYNNSYEAKKLWTPPQNTRRPTQPIWCSISTKKQFSHLSTAIVQLIAGVFFFGMQAYEYSTTLEREHKQTGILWKWGITFYRKRREIPHSSKRLHLAYKLSPTFRTQKNGVRNTTVIQWRKRKHLCPVQFWAYIVTRLDSYLGSSDDNPVNTVWV